MRVLCPLGDTSRIDGEESIVDVVRILTEAVMMELCTIVIPGTLTEEALQCAQNEAENIRQCPRSSYSFG